MFPHTPGALRLLAPRRCAPRDSVSGPPFLATRAPLSTHPALYDTRPHPMSSHPLSIHPSLSFAYFRSYRIAPHRIPLDERTYCIATINGNKVGPLQPVRH